MSDFELNLEQLLSLLKQKVSEVIQEPEYKWNNDFTSFRADESGAPMVRLSMVNFSPDLDIWQRIRNPALVGRFPLTPSDIWEHYAAANFKKTGPDGRPSMLALPESFDAAKKRIKRLVILSAMVVINPQIYHSYEKKIEAGDADPFDNYKRAANEVDRIIDNGVKKLALSLMAPGRAVVPMTSKNTQKIVDRTRGEYRKGQYHGPCNNHWPQNSIAVMTGLLKFGVNRLPFRDEVTRDGERERLFGRYRSIVIFDEKEAVSNGMLVLDEERLTRLHQVNDYTNCEPEIVDQRYCTYNLLKKDNTSSCGFCLTQCPSNSLANSAPGPDGAYSEKVINQKHRFWEEDIAFDFENCVSDRTRRAELFDDYVCARCEVICATRGLKKPASDLKRMGERPFA